MWTIINNDNIEVMRNMINEGMEFDCIYSDMIYENKDLTWMNYSKNLLKENGVFIIQTDFHTNYLVRAKGEDLGLKLINHLVWKNEWGNHPKNRFHQCYDDIIIFSKGLDYKFYSDRIQVPKTTAKTKLNPSGRETKTATAWIDDICLTTTSKERVKKEDGHLVRWQKPYALMDRILKPFTDENDIILDNFSGSGTAVMWAIRNNRQIVGIEYDKSVYDLALKRIENMDIDY